MTLTQEIWRQRWLSSINELTSLELQRKSWLDRQQTNPHWSFVEFMCSYFDDLLCGFPYSHYIEIGWVSPQEYDALRDWHEALSKYQTPRNDDHDRETILADRKWLNIVKAGDKAKLTLANSLSDEERRILTENIDYLQYT
ncbi:MAG: hypothetical protein EOO06_20990 [Chitinophagaceae bacterium]|nr:MAG: hypothetical protein EOO06_20990 [Chitinophagaceae bacterium]